MNITKLILAVFAIYASGFCLYGNSIHIVASSSNQISIRFPDNTNGWSLQESSLMPENWAVESLWKGFRELAQTDPGSREYAVPLSKPQQFLRLVEARWRSSLETGPDLMVFLPPASTGPFSENQHFLVVPISTNTFLAVWTTASKEGTPDQRIVCSISSNGGVKWSLPIVLAGDMYGQKHRASWAFPIVVPRTQRIYVFWNSYTGVSDAREDTTGLMGFRYSDDLGAHWSAESFVEVPKGQISAKDRRVPENWIVWQTPMLINDDEAVVGFTRWASSEVNPTEDLFQRISEVAFMKIRGLGSTGIPLPQISTYPNNGIGLRVPPSSGSGISVVQEPSIVRLSDGTIFCVARTLNGALYWSRSKGGDVSSEWSQLIPLLYDDGTPVRQPIAPAPIYKLGSSNYFLLFHNNSGDANGGASPSDYLKNRRPAFVSFVSESLGGRQPVSVARPSFKFDNSGVGDGPMYRTEVATYPSFFAVNGIGYLWYPDRKHYLLGKRFDIDHGRLISSRENDAKVVGEHLFDLRANLSDPGGVRLIVVSEPSVYLGASVNLVVRVTDKEGNVDQGAVGEVLVFDKVAQSRISGANLTRNDRGVVYLRYKPNELGTNELEVKFVGGGRELVTGHRFLVQASIEHAIPEKLRVGNSDVVVRIDSGISSEFSCRLQWMLAQNVSVTNSGFEFINTNVTGSAFLGWSSISVLGSTVFVETNRPIEGARSVGFRIDSAGSYVALTTRTLDRGAMYRYEFSARTDRPSGSGIQVYGVFDRNMLFRLGDGVGAYFGFGVSTNSDLTLGRLFGSVPNSQVIFDGIKLEKIQIPSHYTNVVLEISSRQLRDFDQVYLRVSNIIGDQYLGPIKIVKGP